MNLNSFNKPAIHGFDLKYPIFLPQILLYTMNINTLNFNVAAMVVFCGQSDLIKNTHPILVFSM